MLSDSGWRLECYVFDMCSPVREEYEPYDGLDMFHLLYEYEETAAHNSIWRASHIPFGSQTRFHDKYKLY